jgi:uncharacterized membrane protein YciS (DUF1049 family)
MTDGVLIGAIVFGMGLATGLLIALYFFMREESVRTQLGEVMVHQQTRIDALEQYIDDHSDGDEVNAEDLWGQG